MQHVARRVPLEQGQEVRHTAPADIRRLAVHRRQIDQQLLQAARRGRSVGQTIHAQRLGGNALPYLGLVGRLGEEFQVGMGVHIDEAGADDVSAGVDDAPGVHRRNVPGHHLNGIAGHGHAAAIAGRPRAVNHRAVGK